MHFRVNASKRTDYYEDCLMFIARPAMMDGCWQHCVCFDCPKNGMFVCECGVAGHLDYFFSQNFGQMSEFVNVSLII